MDAFKTETTVAADGSVVIRQLPFKAGMRVQVTVVAPCTASNGEPRYPLRGREPYRYDAPFGPHTHGVDDQR